jgi:formylmethanofuran dehydrogenase subunit E
MTKVIDHGWQKKGIKLDSPVGILTGRNLRKNYSKCTHCGQHFYRLEVRQIGDLWICSDCVEKKES